jgi:glycosyltransferase involved in cell wall biosynthesis
MAKTPILFLSDSVSCSSGLGRITRDLATRVHEHLGDVYDVATCGYGGPGNQSIPFREYHLHSVDNWLVPELPAIWDDWTQGRSGILMCVWDASRLYWLGTPSLCPQPHLRRFAERKDIQKFIYHAIDAEGPNGGLSFRIAETLKEFDRVLDYSAWSSKITGNPDHLPHGIQTDVFKPYPRDEMRREFAKSGFQGLSQDTFLIGIVATNQARKNWALGIKTAKLLLDRGLNVRVWAHTDQTERHWSLGNLTVDYGLQGRVAVTTNRFTDEQMAKLYSACDVTLGIAPEGFGYPIAESLACGVPVVCGSYGAQAEYVPKSMQVDPIAYYEDGAFCSKRPVHLAEKWAIRVEMVRDAKGTVSLPDCVDWNGKTLLTKWLNWFREGL